MSESCFQLIHSSGVRGLQHSAKHSLPTGLHKMVMRALPSADNEIDEANTASTGRRSGLAAYFAVWKTLHTGKDNQLREKCISDSLHCLSVPMSPTEPALTQNWAISTADAERLGLEMTTPCARLLVSSLLSDVSHLTAAKSKTS